MKNYRENVFRENFLYRMGSSIYFFFKNLKFGKRDYSWGFPSTRWFLFWPHVISVIFQLYLNVSPNTNGLTEVLVLFTKNFTLDIDRWYHLIMHAVCMINWRKFLIHHFLKWSRSSCFLNIFMRRYCTI